MGFLASGGVLDTPDVWEWLRDKHCFVCGEPLWDDSEHKAEVIVTAVGFEYRDEGIQIGMHQKCAVELGVRLIQDARMAVWRLATMARRRPATSAEETPSSPTPS